MNNIGQMKNSPLDLLTKQLSSLPGLGNRSAKRIALHLLNNKDTLMRPLAKNIDYVANVIQACESCGNLDEGNICSICRDPKRDRSIICIVSDVSDLWAIERTKYYNGLYHVLGGVLSALDGIGPEDLTINELVENVHTNSIKEIIIALGATVDGQSTAHYITDQFKGSSVQISRLAHGIPVGGTLDYLDDGTISTALKARSHM